MDNAGTEVVYTYYYAGGRLMRLTIGTGTTMDFFYDQNGQPFAMKYNGTLIYYVLNQQGDVVRLVNSSGGSYGVYYYDAWGNITYTTDSQYLENNPLRYRGYVYDSETKLYYCQSRYYDPAIGRFINADALASTGQGLLGNNMFAYCLNNSVNYADSMGYRVEVVTSIENGIQPKMIDTTASVGVSFSFSMFGFFSYSGQICISSDARGNSELQGSLSGGFAPDNVNPAAVPDDYKPIQASLMGFVTLTNAPAVNYLTGPGCQIGGAMPICGPLAVAYDYNILEDTINKTAYQGATYSFGLSTPGAHIAWGATDTIAKVDFNLFEFFEGVQKMQLEMGYL